jgi:hypothetical protein
MGIPAQAQVGPRVVSDGSENIVRSTRTGEIGSSDVHGRYVEGTSRGLIFQASNSASQALSVANSTATGLILSNPAGSGKNLYILDISVGIIAAVTAVGGIALYGNVNPVAAATTHTTPLIVRPSLLGQSGTPAGLADSAATLPTTPVIVRMLLGYQWVTANATVAVMFAKDEVAGVIGVAPGCTVSVQAVTTAASVIASMTWEELPI